MTAALEPPSRPGAAGSATVVAEAIATALCMAQTGRDEWSGMTWVRDLYNLVVDAHLVPSHGPAGGSTFGTRCGDEVVLVTRFTNGTTTVSLAPWASWGPRE